jgi:polyhydroxyalkanoate synthesis regulator phasin
VGEDPDRIRREIEQTRAEMSETVDALGYKADVKSRAKDSLVEKKESAKESVMGATQTVKEKLVGAGSTVSDATPDREQVKDQARKAKGLAQENPLGLAIGSLAVGFIAGLAVPATRFEDEKLGEVSDDVVDRMKQTGQEALERGKEVAQEAAQSAKETAQQSGQQHAEELKSTAQEHAQQTASQASPTS